MKHQIDDGISVTDGEASEVQGTGQSSVEIPAWKGFNDEDALELVDDTTEDTTGTSTTDESSDAPSDDTTDTGETASISKFDPRTGDLLDEKKGDEGDQGSTNPDEEVYTGLASILKEQGFFTGEDDISTIKDPEQLAAALDKEVLNRLDDRQKEIMEYMNNGVPVQQVSKLQTALKEAESLTPEMLSGNAELTKNLIITDLNHKGLDPESSEKFYNMMVSSNEVQAEAEKALLARRVNIKKMIDQEFATAKQAKEDHTKAQQQEAAKLEEKLSSNEIFGRKLGASTIEKVKKLAGTPVAYTKAGEPMNAIMKYKSEQPVDFEHKLLYLFAVTNGFQNLNAFDRSAESRVSNTMRDSVRRMSSSTSISNNRAVTKAGTTINIDDIDDII